FSVDNGFQNADNEPCEEAKSKTDNDFTELTKTSSNVNTNESAHDDFAEFVTSEHTTNTNINDVQSENATNTTDCVHTNDSTNFDDFGDFGVVNNDSFIAEFKTVDFDPDNSETVTTEIKSFQTTDNSNTTVDDEDFGTFENVNFTANFNEADLDHDENKAMQNKTSEKTEQSDDYGDFATIANDSFVANFDETENDFGEFGSFEENSFPVQSSENHGISSESSLEKVFEQVSNLKLWFLGKENIFERTDEDVTIIETIRQVHDHIEDDVLDTFL
uniref:Aftiphilin clathrin-binding box domain-containing protein n=1 Tax=Ciona savignyi TaxID=51511 RepID=H2Z1I0_CIOSA